METSLHRSWAIIFLAMLISIANILPKMNAMPTLENVEKRESNMARREVSYPFLDTMDTKNLDMLGRLLFLTQKYRRQMSASLADHKFKRQEDIIPCLWNAVSCYRKKK